MGVKYLLAGAALLYCAPAEAHGRGHDEGRGNHPHRGLRIAWMGNDPGNQYDNAILAGARAIAARRGASVTPFYGAFDPALQLEQCAEIVSSGDYDAIMVIPTDGASIVSCVENAKAHRIPVVAVDLPIGTDLSSVEPQVRGQVGAVLTPAAKWGDSLAALVTGACSGQASCKVAYIAGSVDVAFDQMALEDLDAAAEAQSNIQLVAIEEAFYDETLAYELTRGVLGEHPDIDIVIGAGDQMARGAESAINLTHAGQGIRIIGAGAGAYGIQAVDDGRWYGTFVTLPGDEGRLGADIVIRATRRMPIRDAGIDPVEYRGYPAFYTQESAPAFDDFTPQWPG